MAQFPDVEHAVSAVQEILNSPYGPHLRGIFYLVIMILSICANCFRIECIELLDDHSELLSIIVCHYSLKCL